MKITPEVIEKLAAPIRDVYRHLEDELIQNISKRFNTGKGLATTEWQIKKLAEVGALTQENIKTIAKYVGQIPEMTQIALEGIAWETLKELEPQFAQAVANGYLNPTRYAPSVSPSIVQILENYQKQALDTFNLVNTTMLDSSVAAYRNVVNNTVSMANYAEAQAIMNNATGELVAGLASRQEALVKAIKQMADLGVTGFYDRAGRQWSPEAYINMDLRTTFNNVATQTVFSRMDEYGNDLIEVSSHSGARPKCAIVQGKLYSRSGGNGTTTDGDDKKISYYSWSDTSYGEPDGILGINCGHSISPFFPGLSFKRSEETKDFTENNRLYKESQQQRALERDIRSAKREATAQKAAGNTAAFEKSSIKVKQAQARHNNFIDETGRTARLDRTQVVGYDRSTSAKVNAVTNYKSLVGTTTSNGIKVTGISKHFANDYLLDNTRVSAVSAMREALTSPLQSSKIAYDSLGRPSQTLIGEKVTVVINPSTGNLATYWRTGNDTLRKLKGGL
jgi:hypothetical protein